MESTNRQLFHFFDAIKHSDFVSGFKKADKLGRSFRELNSAFDGVLGIFRQTRAEKEEHLQYLNTVVQHVGTGLLSFNKQGKIELINNAARRILLASQLVNINQFKETHPILFDALKKMTKGKALVQFDSDTKLSIHVTELWLRGSSYKLVALQNIQSELQNNEIEAWQNLTRVLRHEIMNSIAPISTLVATLIQILEQELTQGKGEISQESVADFNEGLKTIENRTKALVRFVDAYRSFNNIPTPNFKVVAMDDWFDHLAQLLRPEVEKNGHQLHTDLAVNTQRLRADPELIEMVLINLVKNSIQALKGQKGAIQILGKLNAQNRVVIEVSDNGPGISPEAMDNIFIPFFTTKEEGSGIGLSLSRQIMQLHHGNISAASVPNKSTVFRLRF